VRAGLGGNQPGQADEKEVQARLERHRLADGSSAVLRLGDTWLMSRKRRTHDGGVVVTESDITDLKKVDVAKDEFLATVSHELRTPLTSIRSALGILEADRLATLPDELHKLVTLAQRNCGRLMRIVDDLLDVAKIAAGELKLELRQTALASMLEQTVESRRLGSGASNIRLEITDEARDIRLMADPVRIQQALDNLLSNAMKFSAEDAPIDLIADCREHVVRLSVKDSGVGIPKSFQGKIFDAFTQADSSSTRQRGGTGLGLRIAKTIVEAHRGKIGFSSTEGKGTVFFIDLPLDAAPIAAAEA
jgi:signal transduction histidine kinase